MSETPDTDAPLTALVVGGTGGIGAALVRGLEDDRRFGAVLRTARRAGDDVDAVLDLTDASSIAAGADAVGQKCSRLDLLVVASGVLHDDLLAPEKKLEDLDAARLARYFAVNATGPALVLKHFLPLLKHDRRAVFAAISARVGSIGDNRLGGWYGYRASKAALNMLLRTASIELARRARNVICIGLHPGTVDTPLSRPFQGNVPESRLFSPDRSASCLLQVIDGAGPGDSGRVFAWDGTVIPF